AALAERLQHLLNRREGLEPDRFQVDPRDAQEARRRIREHVLEVARRAYEERKAEWGPELLRAVLRHQLLTIIDSKWMAHLRDMDDLREGIGLRAYGQRNPLLEYQFEGFEMFQNMIRSIQEDVITSLFRIRIVAEDRNGRREVGAPRRDLLRTASTNEAAFDGLSGGGVRSGAALQAGGGAYRGAGGRGQATATVVQRRVTQRVGRNDPCPCGSGKKYKRCCGANNAGSA